MTESMNPAVAARLDEADGLAGFRDQFHIPRSSSGENVIYFTGNSLGLQPKSVRGYIEQELKDWAVSYTHLDVYKRQGSNIFHCSSSQDLYHNHICLFFSKKI